MALLESGKDEEVLDAYISRYLPQANIVRNVLNDVVDISVADAENSLAAGHEDNHHIMFMLITLSLVCIVITVLSAYS